ncbi:MAG: hypothetical protein P1Q69_11165 [Candidatus Thorarchaeota archaeon]|nr:hypothetical protein [Candidatus Thorarchaeota archaeon]
MTLEPRRPQEGHSAHDDGSGQMYVMEHGSAEASESKPEMEPQSEEQEESPEATSEKPRQEGTDEPEGTEKEREAGEPQKETKRQEPEAEPQNEVEKESQERPHDVMNQEVPETGVKSTPSKEEEQDREKTTPSPPEEKEKSSEETKEKGEDADAKKSTTENPSRKKLEDHEPSPYFPNGMPKREVMIPETKEGQNEHEENWLRSEWDKLTEEEKEKYRKTYEKLLETEEDLEYLVKKHGFEHLLEDEETAEEIARYLDFRKRLREELETGSSEEEAVSKVAEELGIDNELAFDWAQYESLPEPIKEILGKEGWWVWSEGKRAYFESFYPQSIEELHEYLEGRTDITAEEIEVIEAWLEIRLLWKKKEINYIVRKGFPLFHRNQIRKLSEKYNIPVYVIRGWLHGSMAPPVIKAFKIAKIASIILSETNETKPSKRWSKDMDHSPRITRVMKKIEGLSSWDDVERMLITIYPESEYKKHRLFQVRKQIVINFFLTLQEAKRGGTITGIAKRIGISRKQVSATLNGQIPYYIRLVLPSFRRSSTMPILSFLVKMTVPEILGERMNTSQQFLEYASEKFPHLLTRNNSSDLIAKIEAYFALYTRLHEQHIISAGQISSLAKEFNLTKSNVKAWICDGVMPELFELVNRSYSRSDIETKLRDFLDQLNGITTLDEMDYRLSTLYFSDVYSTMKGYKTSRKNSERFFHMLETLLRYMKSPSSNPLPKGILTKLHCTAIPKLVKNAASIPIESPQQNMKWLPLDYDNTGKSKRFIQVPEKITSELDIVNVLSQLTSLKSPKVSEYEKRFDKMSKAIALMYLLGLFVADGWFGTKSQPTTSTFLSAATKYDFCNDLGDAFCYTLGLLGIPAKWDRDEPTDSGFQRRWISGSSMLLNWIRRCLLGMTSKKTKSKIPLSADWLFFMPREWRLALLQGLADGDGWASIQNQYIGIATAVNQAFMKKLFSSLGIGSRTYSKRVQSDKKEDIKKARKLPMFKHAFTRQDNLRALDKMLDSMKGNRMSESEKAIIIKLHKRGFRVGKIVEILWRKYIIARRPDAVRAYIRRHEKQEKDS